MQLILPVGQAYNSSVSPPTVSVIPRPRNENIVLPPLTLSEHRSVALGSTHCRPTHLNLWIRKMTTTHKEIQKFQNTKNLQTSLSPIKAKSVIEIRRLHLLITNQQLPLPPLPSPADAHPLRQLAQLPIHRLILPDLLKPLPIQ